MSELRSIAIRLVVAALVAAIAVGPTIGVASAAPPVDTLYSSLQQPPPPEPPPTTNKPGVTGSTSEPMTNKPGATGSTSEPMTNKPGVSGQPAPPVPASVPAPGQPLPDPKAQMVAPQGAMVDTHSIATNELEVVADRGCPSQYMLGDPIQFIGRRGQSQASGYWLYMEIWNSVNDAWWTKLAADWVEPGGSLSRSGRIAEPVGAEQLYSRLIDQYGNVVQQAWCEYSSSAGPAYEPIKCNQTVIRTLGMNEEHRYSFYGVGGRQVQISMQGPQGLDTYLELRTSGDNTIASNDDINRPYDLNSRMSVRLPTTDTFTIVARGFKRQPGQYNLSVFCN